MKRRLLQATSGATRYVLIINESWVVKVPRFGKFRAMLWGLLSNMQEVTFSKTKDPRLAPVSFWFPLGLLLVMKYARPMTGDEYENFDSDAFCLSEDDDLLIVPAEPKASSFGWIGDRVVCIDYGGPDWYEREKTGDIYLYQEGWHDAFKSGRQN